MSEPSDYVIDQMHRRIARLEMLLRRRLGGDNVPTRAINDAVSEAKEQIELWESERKH